MILIKLGGSIITNKQKALSARRKAIDSIARNLKKIDEPMIIVHGGGSYGHYWSVKYNMHTKPAKYDMHGVSIVKNSMIQLDKIILDSLEKNKLNPYSIPPTDFMNGNKSIRSKILEMEKIAKSKLIPVTYGDALWYGQKKSYILSGDKIMTLLAKILRPRLSIFALDVDGVYSNTKTKEVINEIKATRKIKTFKVKGDDVTGGMSRKIAEATAISKLGLNIFFVNGNKPQRIVKAIKENSFEGTIFRGGAKK